MEEQQETPFDIKCEILGDLWINYKNDPQFVDFIQYNDIGLPLAFLISEQFVKINDKGILYINETFDLLLAALGIKDDTGFESIEDLIVE